MNPKLVRFNDGAYGVRMFSILTFSYKFLDLSGGDYWWSYEYKEKYCKGTEAEAKAAMGLIDDVGTQV